MKPTLTDYALRAAHVNIAAVAAAMHLALATAGGVHAKDLTVQSAPPLDPDAARASFTLPPGFEIQLVAAEPAIAKPISMAFDAAGRLWVAETRTYPVESNPDKTPRDTIRILSAFGPDGRAGRNEVFADGLVMPDAVAPHTTGAIVYGAPDILNCIDDDGDGKADRNERLYGPFCIRDMHNMANSFRRGFDGWIYGCHGILNESLVHGTDGHTLRIRGGVFRFRPDGSRIESFTRGQSNPFGLCFDAGGSVFTSDCHSLPIFENLQGGIYPGFGSKADGLGFAPAMMRHSHGSTAIAGLCLYDDGLWPEDFRGNMFLGNVVTNRVNRDRFTTAGSTKSAHEMPDLIGSSDPWFRPVDVQLGPDGALYIADFYNRIIAHVEVPLDHPGRDRHRGRIWRVVYRGDDGVLDLHPVQDLTKSPVADVVAALGHPNLTVRLTALNRLVDIGGDDVVAASRTALRHSDPSARSAAVWVVERLHKLATADIVNALGDSDALVRTHALRVLADRPVLGAEERQHVMRALSDTEAIVVRTAAEVLGLHPDSAAIPAILAVRSRVGPEDASLMYVVRKSLRDHLQAPSCWASLRTLPLTATDRLAVVDVCGAIPSADAAAFLLEAAESGQKASLFAPLLWGHAARYLPEADLPRLVSQGQQSTADSIETETAVIQAIRKGLAERGVAPLAYLGAWAAELVDRLLTTPVGSGDPARPVSSTRLRKEAATLAADLGIKDSVPTIAAFAADSATDLSSRAVAVRALVILDPSAHLAAAATLLRHPEMSPTDLASLAVALGQLNTPDTRATLVAALETAPQRIQTVLAEALAGTSEGADALLAAIGRGRASSGLMASGTVKAKVRASRPDDPRITAFSATAAAASRTLQDIIDARVKAFVASNPDAARGERVFAAKCGACHSAGVQGEKLAPGLSGVGVRGVERLCEDILAPNRNVDHAFRTSILVLADGQVVTGLVRREDGELTVLADTNGKEFTVPTASVEERVNQEVSLMPEGFAEAIPPADFSDLLAFLLTLRATAPQ